ANRCDENGPPADDEDGVRTAPGSTWRSLTKAAKSSTSRRPDRPPVGLPLANSLATQASARWARSSAAVTSTGVVHELLVGLVASNVSSEQDQQPKRSSMSVMASAPVTTTRRSSATPAVTSTTPASV